MKARYHRPLLKVSGEGLAGGEGSGLDPAAIQGTARQLRGIHELGVQLSVVVGGGNIIRGMSAAAQGMDRATADYMGMLAGVINGMALQSALEQLGVETRVLTALAIQEVAETYIRRRAIRHLEKGRVVIFAGGTGNPYFTTDTAAALRAAEIGADVILKATQVDGVYDADPALEPNAKRYDRLTFEEAIHQNLQFMDQTAIQLCRENGCPIVVFDMSVPGNIHKVVVGETVGTTVSD